MVFSGRFNTRSPVDTHMHACRHATRQGKGAPYFVFSGASYPLGEVCFHQNKTILSSLNVKSANNYQSHGLGVQTRYNTNDACHDRSNTFGQKTFDEFWHSLTQISLDFRFFCCVFVLHLGMIIFHRVALSFYQNQFGCVGC